MSLSRWQTLWLIAVSCIVCSSPLVLVLSGVVPALINVLVTRNDRSEPFGLLIACNDLGNIYYLTYQWLLQTGSNSHRRSDGSEERLYGDVIDPMIQILDHDSEVRSSILTSDDSNLMDHVVVEDPVAEDAEYIFLKKVWDNEHLKTGLDFTKLYALGHNLDINSKIIRGKKISPVGCSKLSLRPLDGGSGGSGGGGDGGGDESTDTTTTGGDGYDDGGGGGYSNETQPLVSTYFEIRPNFNWYPGGIQERTGNVITYHVNETEFRYRSCVLGQSEVSSQMTDDEWCSDLSMIPGYGREIPFIEPRTNPHKIMVNVTAVARNNPMRNAQNCDQKPLALNDRTSYYDNPFSTDSVSMQSIKVEQGPSQSMGILLARAPLFWGTKSVSNHSISLIYVCHSFSGDPTSLGVTLLLDYDTKEPKKASGGAKFLRLWSQTNPKDNTTHQFLAYIHLCGNNTHSLVINQVIPGPLLETGVCTQSFYSPRSYYLKELHEIQLTSSCHDRTHSHDCEIYCQKIYDFSVRNSDYRADDEVWAPKDDTFYILTLTICSAGWRFDRIRLPFLDVTSSNFKVEQYEVSTKFVWQARVEPTTRIQFDNFDAPYENRQKLDGIWHSQVAQMLVTVNGFLAQPYKQYCAFADRNLLWNLELETILNTRACIRRWLNYPSRLPHLIRPINNVASVMAVREFGIFMFNNSCSYCSSDTFPITKIPRSEELLISRFDGISGDPHVINLSPIDVIGDVQNPQILYFWDAGSTSVRWIRVGGDSETDWGVIHTAKTLFVPKFRYDMAPIGMTWTTMSNGTKIVLGSYYGRSMLAMLLKNQSDCTLLPKPLGMTRSSMGAVFANPPGDILIWSEPLRESLLIAQIPGIMKGTIPEVSATAWRRMISLNGKVFSSIGYSARKKQIFMSAPEEGSLYSMGTSSENYNLVFRAADRLAIGDILKALRPNVLYVDPSSDAVYFTALPAINITSYFKPTWGNVSSYDQAFYTIGQYGWRRADDLGTYENVLSNQTSPIYTGANLLPVFRGPTNLANSIWILRPNFLVKTLMTDPNPYYTNPAAHIVGIYGHEGSLICVERRVDQFRDTKFRVIKIPLMTFSPEIFDQVKPIDSSQAQILLDWSTGNANTILAPLHEPGLFDDHALSDESSQVNRSVFGWIAFSLLIIHMTVATAYNFKMTRRTERRKSESVNT